MTFTDKLQIICKFFFAIAHKIFEIDTFEFSIIDLFYKLFTPSVHFWQKAKFWHGLQIGAAGITKRGRRDYKTGQKD